MLVSLLLLCCGLAVRGVITQGVAENLYHEINDFIFESYTTVYRRPCTRTERVSGSDQLVRVPCPRLERAVGVGTIRGLACVEMVDPYDPDDRRWLRPSYNDNNTQCHAYYEVYMTSMQYRELLCAKVFDYNRWHLWHPSVGYRWFYTVDHKTYVEIDEYFTRDSSHGPEMAKWDTVGFHLRDGSVIRGNVEGDTSESITGHLCQIHPDDWNDGERALLSGQFLRTRTLEPGFELIGLDPSARLQFPTNYTPKWDFVIRAPRASTTDTKPSA